MYVEYTHADDGLHDLIRECIEMGSVYGTTLPTKLIIPNPTTISRSVRGMANIKRSEMKTFMIKYYKQGTFQLFYTRILFFLKK